jgi:hypothetical protein
MEDEVESKWQEFCGKTKQVAEDLRDRMFFPKRGVHIKATTLYDTERQYDIMVTGQLFNSFKNAEGKYVNVTCDFVYSRKRGVLNEDKLQFPLARIHPECMSGDRARIARETKTKVMELLLQSRLKAMLYIERDMRKYLRKHT